MASVGRRQVKKNEGNQAGKEEEGDDEGGEKGDSKTNQVNSRCYRY